ncbi:MAG: hypothetical protein ACRCY4_10645 [Brevinema sp.]
MKKIISILFVVSFLSACSVSPEQAAIDALSGEWVSIGGTDVVITFSGNTATGRNGDVSTLANPNTIVLGGNIYVVYSSDSGLEAFRADGDRLLQGGTGAADIATLRSNFDDPGQGFTPSGIHIANRKK